jgi:hypothetical protein
MKAQRRLMRDPSDSTIHACQPVSIPPAINLIDTLPHPGVSSSYPHDYRS